MAEKLKKEHSSELTVPAPLFANFYQDQYRRAVFATAFITLTNLICVFIIIFLLLQKPSDTYIPAEFSIIPSGSPAISDFSVTPTIPIDQPNFHEDEINQWLLNTVLQLFTYDLQEYPQELRKNQTFFLPEAQNQYLSILNNIAPFGEYTQKDTIVSQITPKGAPSVYDQGVNNGRYFWVFDFPVEIQFAGTVALQTQDLMLRIIVVRTSMENDVNGIKIAGISATGIRKNNLPV
jgi:hypothetical protein